MTDFNKKGNSNVPTSNCSEDGYDCADSNLERYRGKIEPALTIKLTLIVLRGMDCFRQCFQPTVTIQGPCFVEDFQISFYEGISGWATTTSNPGDAPEVRLGRSGRTRRAVIHRSGSMEGYIR